MSDHAIYSPSGAIKWLNCPASALIEHAFFANEPNANTELGTLAHVVAAIEIGKKNKADIRKLECLKADPSWDYSIEPSVKVYADYVESIRDAYCEGFIETRLKLDKWIKGSFGTADYFQYDHVEHILTVVDYKHGVGVSVEATDNPQLMLYALGAMDFIKRKYPEAVIDDVDLVIVQPRRAAGDALSTSRITLSELIAFGEKVKKAVKVSWERNPQCVAGPWCDKGFCRARGMCAERAAYYSGLMEKHPARPAFALSVEEQGEILTKARQYAKWLKELEGATLASLLNGEAITGWKAVNGRSVRELPSTNWSKAEETLELLGISPTVLYKKSFVGITELESIVGKKAFNQHLGDLITKSAPKPTLAPMSDKREAITTESRVADMFSRR